MWRHQSSHFHIYTLLKLKYICKQWTAFLFFHGIPRYTPKKSMGKNLIIGPVCSHNKISQREAISSANNFLHPPKLLQTQLTKLQRFRRRALEAVKFCLARESFVLWHPSVIGLSNFARYGLRSERDRMTFCECFLSGHNPSRASVNRRMTLYPFAYFYRTRSLENGADADRFRTKILQVVRKYPVRGVANGKCETLRDGEATWSVFLCEPEAFWLLRLRDLCPVHIKA